MFWTFEYRVTASSVRCKERVPTFITQPLNAFKLLEDSRNPNAIVLATAMEMQQ